MLFLQNWKLINEYTRNNYITRVRTEDEFFKNVIRSPRNYTLIILFNSDRECYACRHVDRSFEDVSVAYLEQLDDQEPQSAFFLRVQVEAMYGVSTKVGI